jgi:choice-of-anchor B domain-containing protein
MKRLLSLTTLVLISVAVFAQQLSQNMAQLSTWRDPNTAVYYNDIWGYAANGHEYAIIGSNEATNFIDITNPAAPVLIKKALGKNTNTAWRDFKTYSHYAYGVADGSNAHSLQIFDLQYLPDSVHKVYDSNAISMSAHTIFIDNAKLYLVSNVRNGVNQAMDVYSLSNPEVPTFLGSLTSTFFNDMHAVFVKNDTAYCSAGWPGFVIYNVANINNPVLVSSLTTYPGKGYNHSSWVNTGSKKMIMTDEVPGGLPVKLYDMTDPQNPVYKSSFTSNPLATPHNTFIVGKNYAVLSFYHDGVQVFDITNPTSVTRMGFYDTYPDNPTDYSGYQGCWGVYPFLPSGRIIASDITYGLFVLSAPYGNVNGTKDDLKSNDKSFSVFPNPSAGTLSFQLEKPVKNLKLTVSDAMGRKLKTFSGNQLGNQELNLTDLAAGLYIVQATGEGFSQSRKVLVRK